MSQSIGIPTTEPKKTAKKAIKGLKFPQPKLLTFKDYERLTPPDSGNYELHNGKIIFMPSPLAPHQIVSGNLHAAIHFHIRKNSENRHPNGILARFLSKKHFPNR